MLPNFTQNFVKDFYEILKADEPFAFSRFHDGEYHLIEGLCYNARSNWEVVGKCWLQEDLREALAEDSPGYFLGISPPCEFSESAAYYRGTLKIPKHRLTFSTVFSHANHRLVGELGKKWPGAIVVSCKNGDITVPETGPEKPWDVDAVVDQLLAVKDTAILVAAGPCANLIVHRYWKRQDPNKRVTILDVGSAIDPVVHGEVTREYQEKDSISRVHKCEWEKWHYFVPLNQKRRDKDAQRAALRKSYKALESSGAQGSLVDDLKHDNIHEVVRRPLEPNVTSVGLDRGKVSIRVRRGTRPKRNTGGVRSTDINKSTQPVSWRVQKQNPKK